MPNLTYHLAKSVEFIACCVGAGRFETPPLSDFQCTFCATREDGDDLCEECQQRWLDEVSILQYSNAFERRVNTSVGVAGLGMSFSAAAANWSLGEAGWEQGGMVTFIINTLTSLIPTPVQETLSSSAARAIMTYIFILAFLISMFAVIANLLVSGFVMAMNPTGERHWRHMGWGVYMVIACQVMAYAGAVWSGVGMVELLVVVAPAVLGGSGVALGYFIGGEVTDGDEREHEVEEGGIRLGEEDVKTAGDSKA